MERPQPASFAERRAVVDPRRAARRAATRSPLPTAFLDPDALTIREANAALGALLELPCGALIGRRCATLFVEAEAVERLLARAANERTGHASRGVTLRASSHLARTGVLITGSVGDERGGAIDLVVQFVEVDPSKVEAAGIVAPLPAAPAEASGDGAVEGIAVIEIATGRVTLDPRGRVLLGVADEQPASLELLGRIGLRVLERAAGDVGALLDGLIAGEDFVDVPVVRPGGDPEHHLLVSGHTLCDRAGRVTHGILVARDVTEQRALEHLRDRSLSLISHDMRGPLSVIRMSTEMELEEAGMEELRRRRLARVVRSVDRMERMVRDLLDAQRIRAGELLPIDRRECDLVELAGDVVDELALRFGARFVMTGPARAIGMWSPDDVRRAIWNLVSNAAKYADPDTSIVLEVVLDDDRAALRVWNQGPPIAADELPYLFSAYRRSRNHSVGGPAGWGLGLTLVRGCAQAHGGTVGVTSDEQGTTFTLTLPRRMP